MTNPFLEVKVDAAIITIEINTNENKLYLKFEKPCSLLAVFYHHQKDGRRILKNGP
jgi:hypothetical protein